VRGVPKPNIPRVDAKRAARTARAIARDQLMTPKTDNGSSRMSRRRHNFHPDDCIIGLTRKP
jgi:hypothetical protein